MTDASQPKTLLAVLLAHAVQQSWITEAQSTALYSCAEVGYEGAPEDIARDAESLMRPHGDRHSELFLGPDGFGIRVVEQPAAAAPGDLPRWRAEFPDFGTELGMVVPHGWDDESWSREPCPSFGFDVTGGDAIQHYKLFVDYPTAAGRDLDPRFRLALFDEAGSTCIRDVYETDDGRAMSAFCALIALRDEVLDWQASLAGEREGLDELCSSCDEIIDGVQP